MEKEHFDIALAAVRAYDESHPRPKLVSKTQAAEMLGITYPTLSRLIEAGHIRVNQIGKIHVSEIDRQLL